MKDAKSTSRKVVLAAFLACFCLFGFRSTFSILQVPMGKDLGWTGSQLSMGYSLMMMVYAVTAFFAGKIVDKSGCRPVYFAGAVFCCLGMVATSFINDIYIYFFTYGVFAGIGTGMLWVSSTTSCRKWFIGDRYSTAWGIAFAGAPISQVLLTLFMKPFLAQNASAWRTVMLIMGFVFLALLSVSALVAQRNPGDLGLEPFGQLPQKKEGKAYDFTVAEAFRTRAMWCDILAFLFAMLGEFLIWSQIVKYWTVNLSMDLGTASNMYIIIGVCGIFTMPLLGKVADRLVKSKGNEPEARRLVLIAGPIVGAIGCVLLLMMKADQLWLGAICCVLFACYWAVEPGGCAGYAGAVFGNKYFGKVWGFATLIVMFVGPATGSFMGGFLADMTGNYTASVIFALCGFILSVVMALLLPKEVKAPVVSEEAQLEFYKASVAI